LAFAASFYQNVIFLQPFAHTSILGVTLIAASAAVAVGYERKKKVENK